MSTPFPQAVIFDLDNTLHSILLACTRAEEVLAAHLDDPLGEFTFRFLNGDKPTPSTYEEFTQILLTFMMIR
jgi:FMN phosphatase YigB (HAD superfamily)